jgi:hypothetical protein
LRFVPPAVPRHREKDRPGKITAPKRFFLTRNPIHPKDATLRFASTP